jgi:hypothetical protein
MRECTPGHWQLRALAGPDPVTGNPRQMSRTFTGGELGAAKALTAFVAKVGAGKFTPTTTTVGQLLDKWLELAPQRQRPCTLYENRSEINS